MEGRPPCRPRWSPSSRPSARASSRGPSSSTRRAIATSPQSSGKLSGKLLVGSDDPDEPIVEIALSGLGVEPEPEPPPPEPSPLFRRADLDASGTIDIADPIRLLGWLFLGQPVPPCEEAADANSSRSIDITDAIFILGWLFLGGPEPPPPGPSCGEAPGGVHFPCDDSPCEPICPDPIDGAGPDPDEGVPPEDRDTYTVYIQNVFLIPDAIRENFSDDFTTLCDVDRGLVIAEKILEIDADIVVITEGFVSDQPLVASDGMLAIEARLARDC
jgi:hypothetical protein